MSTLDSPSANAAVPSYAERNAPYWRRNLVVCVFGSFTTLVSLSMLLPFLPLYVRQLGVSSQSAVIQWSGVAFSATFLGTAVTAPIWGRLAVALSVMIRNYACFDCSVRCTRVSRYESTNKTATASTVMVGTQAPRERAGWALGILSTGALAGNLVGPLVGGFLPGWIGIRGTFFAGGAMIAVAALCTIFIVKEDFNAQRDAKRRTQHTSSTPPRRANASVVAALLVTAMMVLLANMSIEPIITVYISSLQVDAAHLARVAGAVMACSALGSMLTAARLGALADRIGSWRVIIGCLLLTGLAMIPQAFVTHWWQLAGLRVVMGMTLAGLLPSIGKLARHSVDESSTGRLLGWLQSAQFSGQVIGPVIGGLIGVHLGLHAVFFATGALLVSCAGLAQWARNKEY